MRKHGGVTRSVLPDETLPLSFGFSVYRQPLPCLRKSNPIFSIRHVLNAFATPSCMVHPLRSRWGPRRSEHITPTIYAAVRAHKKTLSCAKLPSGTTDERAGLPRSQGMKTTGGESVQLRASPKVYPAAVFDSMGSIDSNRSSTAVSLPHSCMSQWCLS
jgi:hypothetical protein